MFDLGITELLLIVIVAVVVIGPKDMPKAMRQAGRWIAKLRKLSGHFRSGIDTMVREAELEDMEKKWAAKNAAIMKEHPPEKAAQGSAAEAKVADAAAPEMTPLAQSAEAAPPVDLESPVDLENPGTPPADSDTGQKA